MTLEEAFAKQACEAVNKTALEALNQIRMILELDDETDAMCLEKMQAIVRVFEAYDCDVQNRHGI